MPILLHWVICVCYWGWNPGKCLALSGTSSPYFFPITLETIGDIGGTESSLSFSNMFHFALYLDKLCPS